MLKDTIINIISNIWPMLLIFLTIIISMRVTYVINKKGEFVFYKDLFALAFIVYILCLFYIVTFQDVSWSTSNFVPFTEMFRYELWSPMFFRNFLGNVILFTPYGFFISYFLELKKLSVSFILISITSVTIEVTQLMIGRVFDIDDIILNILGGLVGFILYRLLKRVGEHLPEVLKNNLFYNIIMVLFLLLLTIVIVMVW